MSQPRDAADSATDGIFDPGALLESIDHDLEAFGELAALFLMTSSEQVDVISRALEAGDLARARAATHGLKGSLALFAARPVIDSLVRLEHDCRDAVGFDRRSRAVEVAVLVARVRASLVAYCARRGIDLGAGTTG